MKACQDCIHCIPSTPRLWQWWRGAGRFSKCGKYHYAVGATDDDYVFGKEPRPYSAPYHCSTARDNDRLCGPEARGWEAKQ